LEEKVTWPVRENRIYPHDAYRKLAALVTDLCKGSSALHSCSIITFNYDLALDYALHFETLATYYCLPGAQQNAPALLKLHGSLNWAKCGECNAIIPWTFSEFFRKYGSSPGTERVALQLGSRAPKALIHCNKPVLRDPVVVPPTWNKTDYQSGIAHVWKRAALELSEAEHIFVAGYSLTETDSFFRYLFALGSVGEKRLKRFWVFDPDGSGTVEKRFRKLLGPGAAARFQYLDVTFDHVPGYVKSHMFSS
jgi:NAD-dependent SIR2 family protein deacetylase